MKAVAFIRVARARANRYLIVARGAARKLVPDAAAAVSLRPIVDISGLEPDPKMDSFELNKILGAILATCLILLVTSFTAGALFSPQPPEKPVSPSSRRWKAKPPGPRKPRPRRPSRSRSCCRPPPSRRGAASAKKCAACHTFEKGGPQPRRSQPLRHRRRPQGRRPRVQFLRRYEGQGRRVDLRRPQPVHRQSKGFIPGTAMGFAGIPKDSERADVIAYLRSLSDSPVPLPTASK